MFFGKSKGRPSQFVSNQLCIHTCTYTHTHTHTHTHTQNKKQKPAFSTFQKCTDIKYFRNQDHGVILTWVRFCSITWAFQRCSYQSYLDNSEILLCEHPPVSLHAVGIVLQWEVCDLPVYFIKDFH